MSPLLDIDLKTSPRTCRVNCLCGMLERSRTFGTKITGKASKVNMPLVSPEEMQRKLRGWHARKGHVHVQRVSSRLEEMSPR